MGRVGLKVRHQAGELLFSSSISTIFRSSEKIGIRPVLPEQGLGRSSIKLGLRGRIGSGTDFLVDLEFLLS